MAREFDGVDNGLLVNAAVISGLPFTIAVWAFPDIATTYMEGVAIVDQSVDNNTQFRLSFRGDVAGDPVRVTSRKTIQVDADTTTGFTTGEWNHACGVFAATNDRRVFLNGGSKGTNATENEPTIANMDRLVIGRLEDLSPGQPFDGRIAEVVVWNVALTDAEVAIIARPGFPQHRYRPGNIIGYWPLGMGSPEPDWSGQGNNLTVTGATIADHVPIAPPFGFDLGWQGAFAAAAPGGLSIPVGMHHYKQLANQ